MIMIEHKNLYVKDSMLRVKESYKGITHNSYAVDFSGRNFFINRVNTERKYLQSFGSFLRTAFLPHGYPDSVSKDYIQYQVWDSVQAFASSITGSLCTHAVLKGAGVGDKNASALAATLTWLYKDGTSMIGRIIFVWSQGTKLDFECKKFRLFADVMNDLAMLMDLLSAYFRDQFMLIICISGLMKSIVGVAGGSTRVALTQHQARKNNLADVSAKDGSQETLVNLLALICSLLLVPVVTKTSMLTWSVFIFMTFIHLMANYFAVKSVCLENFNFPRFRIFAESYLLKDNSCFTVERVNQREVFFSLWPNKAKIRLGCSLEHLVQKRKREFRRIVSLYKDSNYILYISDRSSSQITINIAFNYKADVETQMKALFHACALSHEGHLFTLKGNDMLEDEETSKNFADENFAHLMKMARANGFNTNIAFFEIDAWKLDW